MISPIIFACLDGNISLKELYVYVITKKVCGKL